jgi:uncharacterized membrane protein
MDDDRFETLKLVVIIAVIIGLLAAIGYAVYAFSLLWVTFAAGITTALLLILVLVLFVIAIYFWIKNLMIKRELNRTISKLEQTKIELDRYKAKLKSDKV